VDGVAKYTDGAANNYDDLSLAFVANGGADVIGHADVDAWIDAWGSNKAT
jgi:hypothetical protein